MKEPGLDDRHRDKNGKIQQKRSDTQNQNLPSPIPVFYPDTTLKTLREKTGKTSEKHGRAFWASRARPWMVRSGSIRSNASGR